MAPKMEDQMLDFVPWSAAVLALLGFFLWILSGGMRVPQIAAGPHPLARLKRQIRRAAIFATVASALLQAGLPTTSTQSSNIDLWASAAPSASVAPIG